MFRKYDGIEVAEEILQLVQSDERMKNINATIKSYQNGREQGQSIIIYPNLETHSDMWPCQISFSQDRTSDDIVVYIGKESFQAITDEAYEKRQYFNKDDIPGAAQFIIESILSMDPELEEQEDEEFNEAI